MHDESESVAALQQRLAIYRRTIEYLELQRAQFGAFTPAFVWHQFDDTRAAIAQLKSELRALGAIVDDLAGDSAPPPAGTAQIVHTVDAHPLLSVYRRMLVDQVRYLSLAGLSAWTDLSPQLADLYVERALTPLSPQMPRAAYAPLESRQPATLPELLSVRGARVVLEGEPGSGRTTCLHMLALACAARGAGESIAGVELAAGYLEPPLPILLNARDITAALAQGNAVPEDRDLPTPSAFWSAIERWLQYSDLAALVPSIQQLLDRGECLVLIDDLDELADARRLPQYIAALGRFVARYPDNRYVLTSRGLDSGLPAPLTSFARYRLDPLDQGQIDALVERWYTALGQRAAMRSSEETSERVARLRGVLHGDVWLRELAATPRGLVLCILAHAEGYALPAERGLILRRLARLLVERWMPGSSAVSATAATRGLGAPGVPERRLALLEPLALEFQSRLDPDGDQPLPLSAVEIKALLSESRAMASIERRNASVDLFSELLRWGQRYGLLAPAGPGAYTMPHRALREYLGACALAQAPDFVARAYVRRDDPHWHETLRLAVGELNRGPSPNGARELLRLLLQAPDPAQEDARRDLLLAAECLVDQHERAQLDRVLRAGVCERLVRLMEQPLCPVAQRVQAGLLLGRLGDPRFVGLLPPLVRVDAGPFLLGCDDGYSDEGPAQPVDVLAFVIGVYPVTNQQYAAFLAENLAHPSPHYWHDPRYNNPACPVVGVTWHDATAYCSWLTARLARAELLPPGLVVRLPLEVEWEKAAGWDEQRRARRRYAWGDTWDSARANTADGRGDWITAPVGCYPDGVSAYGLHDCIGNVWEWTASEYASYPGMAALFREAGRYTLRGSSCASNPTHARCTYRSRLPADHWRYHLGFRVVLGQPLP